VVPPEKLHFCNIVSPRIEKKIGFRSPGTILLAFARQSFSFSAPRMKRYLPFIIVAVVALITFGSGFAFYRSKKSAAPAAASGEASGSHVRGNADAAVTIEEFGDFQCPPCAMMSGVLHKFGDEYGSRVRLVFHHFPLPVHAHAREAALAAEAAHEQGKFWGMHDALYKEQTLWSVANDAPTLFAGYAKSIGLDVERFKKDMEAREIAERVEADHKLGLSRGVTSTPTLFVNNVLVPPAQLNPDGLKKTIETALAEKGEKK
jgi:protein-disulfide isomerase